MDFDPGPETESLLERVRGFMEAHIYPREGELHAALDEEVGPGVPYPAGLDEIRGIARSEGLWNLFMPDDEYGMGLTNWQYAFLCEEMGRSPILAPMAFNCAAPDTGNMEILAMFGTPEQQERWLAPLLAGEIRSCFSMTEPDVASSDATNIRCRIERDGDEYVITGRKWWSTGALSPRCRLSVVMGVTDPEADTYRRQSMVLVPMDTPGVRIVRNVPVFGYEERGGHAEIAFEGARVPVANLLGDEGSGFAIAQERLGPGRVHHCMRLIGMAERAFEVMAQRAHERVSFGKPLAAQGVVQEWIAEARIRIEQARLLVLKTAWMIDTVGPKGARVEIAAIKVVAPRTAMWVIDRAIQVFGGAGVTDDVPLARLYAAARSLAIADGPDEVHMRSVARRELRRFAPGA